MVVIEKDTCYASVVGKREGLGVGVWVGLGTWMQIRKHGVLFIIQLQDTFYANEKVEKEISFHQELEFVCKAVHQE